VEALGPQKDVEAHRRHRSEDGRLAAQHGHHQGQAHKPGVAEVHRKAQHFFSLQRLFAEKEQAQPNAQSNGQGRGPHREQQVSHGKAVLRGEESVYDQTGGDDLDQQGGDL